MAKIFDRVKFNVSGTPNQGTCTVGTRTSSNFYLPAEASAGSSEVFYLLVNSSNDEEHGIGTVASDGSTVTRDSVLASIIGGVAGTTKINVGASSVMGFTSPSEAFKSLRNVRTVTGASDSIIDLDGGSTITYNRSTAVAVSIAQAGASNQFRKGWYVFLKNIGVGDVTITPATSTIGDITQTTTLVLKQGTQALLFSDGTNYTAHVFHRSIWVATTVLTIAEQTQVRTNIYAAPFDAFAYSGIQSNGSAEISQENGTTARTTDGYVCDGWQVSHTGTMVYSAAQVVDAPPGLTNSIQVSISTAEASLGASDFLILNHPIEGFRTSKLAFGSASAQSISFGFWTKIHRIGTYSGAVRNSAINRSYPFTFVQNVADTWEFKTVTVTGDQSGTWIGNTNGTGLQISFALGAGTSAAGTAATWSAANLIAATGTINGVAATSDLFKITGLVVLPGIELPSAARAPLIMRSFDQELPLCIRYYEALGGDDATQTFGIAQATSATQSLGSLQFLPKRAVPSISVSAAGDFINTTSGNGSLTCSSLSFDQTSKSTSRIVSTCSSGLVAGNACRLVANGTINARIKIDARL